MGVYDMFEGEELTVQVKMTNDGQSMSTYKVGDSIKLSDCVIIGYEGYVVIQNGTVIMVDSTLYDKWGNVLESSEVIEEGNVIAHILDVKNRVIAEGKKEMEELRNNKKN